LNGNAAHTIDKGSTTEYNDHKTASFNHRTGGRGCTGCATTWGLPPYLECDGQGIMAWWCQSNNPTQTSSQHYSFTRSYFFVHFIYIL